MKTAAALNDDFNPDATFRYAGSTVPSSFDPATSGGGLDQLYMAPIYDRLIYRTPEGELEPMLATAWEPARDGRSLEITLRKGLKFTDGAAFDAQAAKLNLDRNRADESTIRGELVTVTHVDVTGPLTLRLEVTGGVGPLITSLSARSGMMVSPVAIEAGTVESKPVGIGPYVATKVIPGERVSLERNPEYWDRDVQRVATMEIVAMTDAQTRLNALTTGQIDAAMMEPEQIATVQSNDDLEMISGPTPLFFFFIVNSSVKPLDDPLVRRAINLAIDRESIGDSMFEGFCKPQVQLWPEQHFAYDKDFGTGLTEGSFDPNEAKKLMAEAGHEGGFSIDFAYVNNTRALRLAEALQSDLGEIGIDVKLRATPSNLDAFGIEKSMPSTVSGYTGIPDPDAVINRLLAPKAIYNPGGAEYPELVKLAQQGADAVTAEERKPIYAEFMAEFVKADTHLFPICMGYETNAYYPNVSGLHAPSDFVDLRGVAVSDK